MSRLVLSIAVDNAPTGKALGIKEAIAMDLEKYGDVTVLQVETQEPEQLSFNSPPPPSPRRTAPPPSGPSPARPSRPRPRPLASCYTCAHYRPGQGRDERGVPFWGACAHSGRLVYRLIDQCEAWRVMR